MIDPALQEWIAYAVLAAAVGGLGLRMFRRRRVSCDGCGTPRTRQDARADRTHLPVVS